MTEFDKDAFKDSVRRNIDSQIRNGMTKRRSCGPSGATHSMVWGGVLCTVGVLLLLDHFGVMSIGNLWRYWPLLVVTGGVINLTVPGKRPWGVFLIIAGVLFQLGNLNIIQFRWVELWPLAMVAAGGMMIWNAISTRRMASQVPAGEPTMDATAVFGAVERRITARDFRFGRVSAVFGGVELDFRDADIEGDEAVIEINAVFGGVEMRVPANWHVEPRNQTVFGGFTDSTSGTAAAVDPAAPKRKTLIVTGSAVFGGIEIQN
jgi:predicted membrane protein